MSKTAAGVRQCGIDKAVGEYIVCFDADDVMPENYLEEAVKTLEGSAADYAYPRSWWLIKDEDWKENLNQVKASMKGKESLPHVHFRSVYNRVGTSLLYANSDYQSASQLGSMQIISTVCRSTCRQEFDEKLIRLQDWDMHLTLADRGAKSEFFVCPPYIRDRATGITRTVTNRETLAVREIINRKHSIVKDRLFILPLNSRGGLDTSIAANSYRALPLANFVPESVFGDLDRLHKEWKDFDLFYFSGVPSPSCVGWIKLLRDKGKKVYCDIASPQWNEDFKLDESRSESISLIEHDCLFIISNEGLRADFRKHYPNAKSICIEDTALGSEYVKEDYKATGRLVWHGSWGNAVSLLVFSEELHYLLNELDYTLRLVCDSPKMRLPFRWEWEEWKFRESDKAISECDIHLLTKLDVGSYKMKGRLKSVIGDMLAMPTVTIGRGLPWQQEIRELCSDENLRKERGRSAIDRYCANECSSVAAVQFLAVNQRYEEIMK